MAARPPGALLRLLAIAVLLAACGEQAVAPLEVGRPPESLADLPACGPAPTAATPVPTTVRERSVLPDQARILRVDESDAELVTAAGWAPLTAPAFRATYQSGLPDGWEPVTLENELTEAEILLRRGEVRFFVQAVASCRDAVDLYVRILGTPGDGS